MTLEKQLPAPITDAQWDQWDRSGVDQANQVNQAKAEPVKLSAEQVAAISAKSPSVSPWRVVGWQLMASVVIAALAWAVSGERAVALSALWGGLTVALPAAVLARGMSSPLGKLGAVSSAMSFMVWEMVKIGLSVAMLIAAAQWEAGLSWPALLISMVLTMKIYWLAAVFKPAAKNAMSTSNERV